jgi:hypothetical protein
MNPALSVKIHQSLLLLLAVVFISEANLVHFGLELLHGPHVVDLTDRKREQDRSYRDREEDDAQPPRRPQGVEQLEDAAYDAGQRAENPPEQLSHESHPSERSSLASSGWFRCRGPIPCAQHE